MIGFSSCFLIELGGFLSKQSFFFFLVFSFNFGCFSPIDIHGFFLSFLLGLGVFFPINKAIISSAIQLSELASKREANYDIMMSYDESCRGANLVETISYHNLFWGWPLINYLSLNLPNLFGQSFKLMYIIINLLNQSTLNRRCY